VILQPLGVVEHRAVRHRLDRGRHQERRQLDVGDAELVASARQVPGDRREHRPLELVALGRLAEPRHLLHQHAVQIGIDRVRAHDQLDHRAHGRAQRQIAHALELGHHRRRHLVLVAPEQRRDQRLLRREVLVERADRHAGGLRDLVGRRPIEAVLDQKASGRLEDRIDGRARPGLNRGFAWRGAGLAGHGMSGLDRHRNASCQCEQ